jgi:hypothetical protein
VYFLQFVGRPAAVQAADATAVEQDTDADLNPAGWKNLFLSEGQAIPVSDIVCPPDEDREKRSVKKEFAIKPQGFSSWLALLYVFGVQDLAAVSAVTMTPPS